MSRKCSKCLRVLDETEFNWKFKNIKLQYHCKECSRKYVNNHYKNNKQYYINKAHRRNHELKIKTINYIGNYLKAHKCVDCGEPDVLVLEFDHRIPKDKYKDVSKMIKNRGSLASIISEISKCDVRCANCHKRKTAKETGSWRLEFVGTHSSIG